MPRAERQAAKKERDAEKQASSAAAERSRAEDEYWSAAGEGKASKAQAKRAQQEAARGEAAAKKLEAKRLAEQEEAELSAPKGKGSSGGGAGGRLGKPTGQHHGGLSSGGKLTQHEIAQRREREEKERAAAAEARARAARREMSEDEYARAVEVENTNKADDGAVDARSLTEAVEALSFARIGASDGRASPALPGGGDAHPEKRMKAAFLAYEERHLPLLRMEKPGLKQSQYKEMVWRQWQKAPENPVYAAGGRR